MVTQKMVRQKIAEYTGVLRCIRDGFEELVFVHLFGS